MNVSWKKSLRLGLLAVAVTLVAKTALMLVDAHRLRRKPKTVEDRLREHGAVVDARLRPAFASKGVAYPPAKATFIGLKDEKVLQVYATNDGNRWRLIKSYDVLAASGRLGPKLREGDRQVPEGIYQISSLNPNSLYHLSLRVNYPNEFDRRMATLDKRTKLGGDIMIHGNAVSIGCLAVGDAAAEDLLVLAARTGLQNLSVIISPVDLRRRQLPATMMTMPAWTGELYAAIRREINYYPKESDQ